MFRAAGNIDGGFSPRMDAVDQGRHGYQADQPQVASFQKGLHFTSKLEKWAAEEFGMVLDQPRFNSLKTPDGGKRVIRQ